ncbi:MAG TPA: hypothetical protein VF681_13460 [Abditibacteriaceae bacterium]|jgi:lipopolysaccharide export system protein LptA
MKPTASISTVLFLALVAYAPQANAQTAPRNDITFSGKKQTLRANGIRLDGNARVVAPGELDASADAIAVDADSEGMREVRATGNVKLKIDVPARGGGLPVHIESSSKSASLNPRTRVLTLTGNVSGFYQPRNAGRATLSGETVVLRFAGKSVAADIEGSVARPIIVLLPVPNDGTLAGVGSVRISAVKGNFDESAGSAVFTGGARAISTGERRFEVTANAFTVARSTAGALETLTTSGRTTLKADLPQPTPSATAPASTNSLGTPVRLEVSSDTAVVRRADNTLTFEGNVKGWYELLQPDKTRARYPFTGDRAVVTFVPASGTTPADFALDFSGQPSVINAPQFNLGL